MHTDDLVLVSVDDHVVEPADMFDRHLPERGRDRGPRGVGLLAPAAGDGARHDHGDEPYAA